MQTFKTYFLISKKYLTGFFIYVPIFLAIMMVLINQQSESTNTAFSASKIKIAIFDHDDSTLSKALTSYLEEHHTRVKMSEDMDSIKDNVYQRSVDYILIIPEGYESGIQNTTAFQEMTTYMIPNSRFAAFADSQIEKFMKIYDAYLAAGMENSEAVSATVNTMETETDTHMQSKEQEEISYVNVFYIYLTYILISIIPLCITPILMLFNEKKIKSRLAVSCVSSLQNNLQLALASLIYTLAITASFIIFSFILFKENRTMDMELLRITNVVLYSMICLAFTFFLAACLSKQTIVSSIVNLVGLGQSFICGVFVDRALMSSVVLAFGRIFPAYWYVNVEMELAKYTSADAISNTSSHTILYGFIVEGLFAIALFTMGMVVNKNKKR